MAGLDIQSSDPPPFLATVANRQRWRLIQALARSDHRVQELTDALGEPMNLVSYHLRKLREQSLVHERRSSADARDVYYTLDLDSLVRLYLESGSRMHPSLAAPRPKGGSPKVKRARRFRVLFLCTHNSARSQMAEGVLRRFGGELFDVESAGTEPSQVHPLAIETMAKHGIDLSSHRSKHVDQFVGHQFDYVITVCDVASEVCPVFPGAPERIHWSIADPSAVDGTKPERRAAFERAANELITRIRYLVTVAERRAAEA